MAYHLDDTIVAIASPAGSAARGIVRFSGPAVEAVVEACFNTAEPRWRAARRVQLVRGEFRLAPPLDEVPCDLYYWPNDRSYTGQRAAEVHTIGSPIILTSVVERACAAGARLAHPGEFTLRAFLAGRLDLTQAEAVLGVIDAASRRELDVALRQLGGGLGTPLHRLRETLLDLLAHLEAGLDFVEEDIEFVAADELRRQLEGALREFDDLGSRVEERTTRDEGYRVVFRGLPNAGKSSLLNALAGRAAALVSQQAGTTRDYVTVVCDLEGTRVVLIDTAGIERADHGAIAAAAQQAAHEQLRSAHLELLCIDGSRPLEAWDQQQLAAVPAVPRLVVETKADAGGRHAFGQSADHSARVITSARTGQGIAELRAAIRSTLGHAAPDGDFLASTAARCSDSILSAREALERASAAANAGLGEELVAGEIRLALDELGRMVGAIYTDDILDRIFSRFCIGK